jgi:hypothetical protein
MRAKLTNPQRKSMNEAVTDILQQFVVIIISLGLANAFMVFAPQDEFKWPHVLSFGIYILVSLRFLAANLLYLSYQYGKPDRRPKRIHADAFGMVVTGIVIGLAGSYVTSTHEPAPNASLRFYFCLLIILLADAVFSIWSHAINPEGNEKFFDRGLKSCDVRWVLNNLLFVLVVAVLLWFLWFTVELPVWMMVAVTAISMIALLLTYDGMWKIGFPILLLLGGWLYVDHHRDATSWLMLVTVTNSVISFLLTYEGCLHADGTQAKATEAPRAA